MLDRFSWFSSWSWEICDGPVPLPSLSRRMRSTRQVRTLGLFESSELRSARTILVGSIRDVEQ
jgi:hypothetical protein